MTRATIGIGVLSFLALLPGTARAEIVFLSSGQVLSVKSHRTEGGSLVLVLRSGGEMTCDASIVSRIAPT